MSSLKPIQGVEVKLAQQEVRASSERFERSLDELGRELELTTQEVVETVKAPGKIFSQVFEEKHHQIEELSDHLVDNVDRVLRTGIEFLSVPGTSRNLAFFFAGGVLGIAAAMAMMRSRGQRTLVRSSTYDQAA